MKTRTRGQLEAEIADAIVKFEKDYLGRGPDEAKAYVIDDLVVVRLHRVLTSGERQLAKTQNAKGRSLVKDVRVALIETGRPLLEDMFLEITGCKVVSLHSDISTVTGEAVILFTLDKYPTR